MIETLSTRFNSRVEMDSFSVSVLKGLEVSGDGLRLYPQDEVVAAGATDRLIALGHFSFHANLLGLFVKLGLVHSGLFRIWLCQCAGEFATTASVLDLSR